MLRELGRGAQASVWLAHDTRLDREVALKLLEAGSDAVGPWLREAQAVSRLAHPNIVPVFEADEAHEVAGRPYLVFEYVNGPTLAAHLRQHGGALPAREAVTLMLGVLDALRAAHDCGIVHRDLKPSNVLIDGEGRPRVMDFGIAARITDDRQQDSLDGGVCGTPGYLSPEAARGAAPQPTMDLFAAGVMLAEMLSGRRLLQEVDPLRAIERVQSEDLVLPAALASGATIDDALRAIVQRALARDSAERMPSAAAMRLALQHWSQGAPALPVEPAATAGHATLDFLLLRMKHRSDFPALSDAVSRIQRVANSENENLQSLSAEILKDVALTHKLLRMVNTAHYSAAGGTVSTVSRAVALVGFAGIRNMALSLVLLDHMQDKGHATQLKEEFLRALMAGTLAGELTTIGREAEECFLSAMFQNLGRLLAEFHFPDEARQIRALVQPVSAQAAALDARAAALRVLGIDYGALGQGVAKVWGLPDRLQRAMCVPDGDVPTKALGTGGPERQRWLGRMAAEVTDALLEAGDDRGARLDAIAQRYGRALAIPVEQVRSAAANAQLRLTQLAQAMNLEVGAKARARRLLAATAVTAEPKDASDPLALNALSATAPASDGAVAAPRQAGNVGEVADMLASGVQDITNHMVADNCKLNEVLRMILETMYRGLGFRRIVFCLRDAKTDSLTGRFGLGDGAADVAAAIRVPLRSRPGVAVDLFSAVCVKGVDTLIADATLPAVAQRLPPWFVEKVGAPTFLLLPLMMKNATFALIYADHAQAGGIALGEKELGLLRTLRNQGVMAFRQAG